MNKVYDELSNYKKIKVIVLGDQGVGKTTIINHYISLDWPNYNRDITFKPTVALDIHIQKVISDGETHLVEFIEFAGDYTHMENYDLFLNMYNETTDNSNNDTPFHGIIYVFDVNNHHSLRHVKKWIRWFHKRMKSIILDTPRPEEPLLERSDIKHAYERLKDIPILFMGNKIDTLYESTKSIGDVMKDNIKQNMELTRIKIKDIIKENFTFAEVNNVIFSSQVSTKQDLSTLDSFLMQIYGRHKGSYNYNVNHIDESDDFDISLYPLRKFLFLHAIDYIMHQTFLQLVISKLKIFLGYNIESN